MWVMHVGLPMPQSTSAAAGPQHNSAPAAAIVAAAQASLAVIVIITSFGRPATDLLSDVPELCLSCRLLDRQGSRAG
jgi:hypothetical protein